MSAEEERVIEVKAVIIGNTNSGKTSLIRKAATGVFDEDTVATTGANLFSMTVKVEDSTVKLQLWDTAGQEQYRSLAPKYFTGAKAAIILYSIVDAASFESVEDWLALLKNGLGDENYKQCIIVVAANKSDLEDESVIQRFEGEQLATRLKLACFRTSAKTGEGIQELFSFIADQAMRASQQPAKPPVQKAMPVQKEAPVRKETPRAVAMEEGVKKGGCC